MSSLSIQERGTILRRLSVLAVAFFFVKGLLWLAAPFLFLYML